MRLVKTFYIFCWNKLYSALEPNNPMIKNKGRVKKIRSARKDNEKDELKLIEERLMNEAPPSGVSRYLVFTVCT